ncbi:MAG: MerR family transcriptional regulator [Oscillospiraceae bacterium]|nr:MerR family transcriptional regulator [Oscillospiraceae bacterium]
MYTMKQACEQTGLSYETLKFYCNQGLVPNVKRDSQNRRIFSDKDIAWINSLSCLKNCNMGIAEMKEYLQLCLQGQGTIPERKVILERKRRELELERQRIQDSIAYIDWKQGFYDDILSGKQEYFSNLSLSDRKEHIP